MNKGSLKNGSLNIRLIRSWLGCALFSLLLAVAAQAQRRSDPLTQPEVDQLRDTALEAEPRLKLFVGFARARLTALEQVHSDDKITDKGQAIHDRLQEFVDVYDELNDNLDTFNNRKADLRKVLKTIMEADSEFQARLRALKDSAEASKDEAKQYEFMLSDAADAVDSSARDHRQLLDEQDEAAKRKKERKH